MSEEKMNVRVLRIEADGTVTPLPGVLQSYLDGDVFDGCADIVTLGSPELQPYGETFVGAVDDFGFDKRLGVNVKAWALYGRSPIYGTMFVAVDSTDYETSPPLPYGIVELLLSDVDWIGDRIRGYMAKVLGYPVEPFAGQERRP